MRTELSRRWASTSKADIESRVMTVCKAFDKITADKVNHYSVSMELVFCIKHKKYRTNDPSQLQYFIISHLIANSRITLYQRSRSRFLGPRRGKQNHIWFIGYYTKIALLIASPTIFIIFLIVGDNGN